MSRDWKLYWDDIITACEKVERYTAGLDRARFESDERTVDAVVRNLEIVGEAAKKLPPAARLKCPEIDWRKIAGLRDFVAHAYFGLDMSIIWDVIQTKVPQLLQSMRRAGSD